jgi:hypothetical protein
MRPVNIETFTADMVSSCWLLADGFDADVADSLTSALFKITSLIIGLAMCYPRAEKCLRSMAKVGSPAASAVQITVG